MTVPEKTALNIVKYSGRDFPTWADTILRRMKEQYSTDYNDYEATAPGIMLTDLEAHGLAQLSWMLDRRVSDCYGDTVRTRAAAARISKSHGYKMYGAVPSGTDLTVTFAAVGVDDKFPKGFQFTGPNGLIFEATNDVNFLAAATSATVPVHEGETKQSTFVSTGLANQRLKLTSVGSKFLAEDSVEVKVGGVTWTEQDFLSFDKTNQYEVGYNDSPPTVGFGDGFAGNIPGAGVQIVVRYRVINGLLGNVGTTSISAARSKLVIGGNTIALTVTNIDRATGGDDPETIDHMRKYMPLYVASRNAAVTENDYAVLAGAFSDVQYGAVAKAFALNPRLAQEDVAFRDMVNVLADDVVDFGDGMTVRLTSLGADVDNLAVEAGVVAGDMVTAQSISSDIATYNSGMMSVSRTVRGQCGVISSTTSQMDAVLATLDAKIIAYVADPAHQAELLGYKLELQTYANLCDNQASSGVLFLTGVETTGLLVVDKLTDLNAELASSSAQAVSMVADSGLAVAEKNAMIVDLNAFLAAHVVSMTAIKAYVDELFDSSCKANVVSVPVLAKDATGFFVGASSGLIRKLQEYLDGRKEVTQLVQVVSGVLSLLPATISIVLGVNTGYKYSEVGADIVKVLDELLKDRDFNENLYVSDIYAKLKEKVAGYSLAIKQLNVVITGPVDYLDVDGNLIPGKSMIVTKGTITVTEA